MRQYDRVWATIDLDAIIYNINSMKKHLEKAGFSRERVGMYAAVKADAYGHGLVPVAKSIEPMVLGFGVATIDEGILLREHGIEKPVLILSTPNERRFEESLEYELRLSVYTMEAAARLSALATAKGKNAIIHLAVDTGMSRIGMTPTAESADMAFEIAALPGIQAEGIFTHFTKADEPERDFSRVQTTHFLAFLEMLRMRGLLIPIRHVSNSAAIMELPELTLDAVRAGISLYGLSPAGSPENYREVLKPALELKSEISYLKIIEPGTPVSYGGTYTAKTPVRVATIPVGYGDGYPRNLSGKGYILVKGSRAPILGRVCMDQMMVDVTGMDVGIGDEVTLIGRDGGLLLRIEDLAAIGGGFHYEIACALGKRVPRIYVRGKKAVAYKDYFTDRFSWPND